MIKKPILYIVVPCYKEEEVLPETSKRLKEKINNLVSSDEIDERSRIMFVNDGSTDKTWEIISKLHNSDKIFSGVNLAHNRGHQNALLAGLMTAKEKADIIISMDADLQDDINAVDEMIAEYKKGNDVVYGVRSARDTDTFFKRFTAESFYKLMSALGVDIVFNHADYRLMSKRAVESLAEYKEVNLFLRGVVRHIGYPSSTVMYERHERFAGESKYPLKKMIAFALDGITSFSVKPLKMISNLGIVITVFSIIAFIWCIFEKIFGSTTAGWTSTIVSIWFIGGIQLLSLGVIGEYIGKIYNESKQRPRFIIEKVLDEQ